MVLFSIFLKIQVKNDDTKIYPEKVTKSGNYVRTFFKCAFQLFSDCSKPINLEKISFLNQKYFIKIIYSMINYVYRKFLFKTKKNKN